MDKDLIQSMLDQSRSDLLWTSTHNSLAGLSPELENAAYRCAILHWFDADSLKYLMGIGRFEKLGRNISESKDIDAEKLYRKLQELPFIEMYSDRGHSFHDLTRDVILKKLWEEENSFFKEISLGAAQYYYELEAVELFYIIEIAYHLMVVEEEIAVNGINDLLESLIDQGQIGEIQALIRAADEHYKNGRLSPEVRQWVEYWRLLEILLTGNMKLLQSKAQKLLDAPDDQYSPVMKIKVRSLLANGYASISRYDKAIKLLEANLKTSLDNNDLEDYLSNLVSIADILIQQSKYSDASMYFFQALEIYVENVVLMDPEQMPNVRFDIYDISTWNRFELDEITEEAKTNFGEAIIQLADKAVMYAIEYVEDQGENTGEKREPEEIENKFAPIIITPLLANIWLQLGWLYFYWNKYEIAHLCGNLAGSMYDDLGEIMGLQLVTNLISSIADNRADPEVIAWSTEIQEDILNLAREYENNQMVLESLLILANKYMGATEYSKARNNYEEALELAEIIKSDVGKANALDGLARLEWIAGKYKKAGQLFDEVIAIYESIGNPEGKASSLISLGKFKADRKNYLDAEQHYCDALYIYQNFNLKSNQIGALEGLADLFNLQQKYDKAIDYYSRIIEISRDLNLLKSELESQIAIASITSNRGEIDKAQELFEKVLAKAKETDQQETIASVCIHLGDLFIVKEEYSAALKNYQQAHDIFEKRKSPAMKWISLIGIIHVHQSQKNKSEALQLAKEMLEFARNIGSPDWITTALLELSECYKLDEDYEMMFAVIEEAHAIDPANIEVLIQLGNLYSDIGAYEPAVQILLPALVMKPNVTHYYNSLGWALENAGQHYFEQAVSAYSKGLELVPDDFWLRIGLGDTYRALGNNDAARDLYEYVIRNLESKEIAQDEMDMLGWCYYRIGSHGKAIEAYQKFLEKNQSLSTRFDLGLALLCNGNFKQANKVYEAALTDLKKHHILRQRGLLFIALKDFQDALTHYPSLNKEDVVKQINNMILDTRDKILKQIS